jgi:hypothetical protein
MAGKNYYGYQGHSGYRSGRDSDGLFGWTVFIFLLIGFVFLCWMGSYYIFAHPEKAANYRLLLRLHKIDAPQRFEITGAPRGEFLKPGMLLERFGSMTSSEIRRSNETLLRNFLRNYHQNRDLVPYAVGTYRVIGTLPLGASSFCQPGLVALLQAVEQPEVLLEQPFTCDEANLPALKRSLTPGQEIKLEKPLDLSAVIHISRPDEKENRLLLTTMPLLYGSYGSAKGGTSFSLEPPVELNLDSDLPVLSREQISELSGGKLTKGGGKAGLGLRISRIAEEEVAPTPEPKVAKAIAAAPSVKAALPVNEPAVARAIPVNEQPVLPAIPVGTPASLATAVSTPIPAPTPVPAPSMPPERPAATPLLAKPVSPAPATPAIPAAPTNPPVTTALPKTVSATNAVISTNQPSVSSPTEVWPVYAPGQMPRGRLVDPSEGQQLAARGIAGERNYLEGRFTVTASGNGRAVLRPQGGIAGVPMGSSAKVRVIVEFPAGAIPPTEGAAISRDNLRPFQITSVKRGDDGQINIYAREVTR